jgi:hypothetical protein
MLERSRISSEKASRGHRTYIAAGSVFCVPGVSLLDSCLCLDRCGVNPEISQGDECAPPIWETGGINFCKLSLGVNFCLSFCFTRVFLLFINSLLHKWIWGGVALFQCFDDFHHLCGQCGNQIIAADVKLPNIPPNRTVQLI